MLGNRPRPMISKLSKLLISGARAAALMDTSAGSPRGPLDMSLKTQSSPRGLKSYDLGGIGLGIVVALSNSGEAGGREILPKSAVCSPGLTRSEPIPVQSIKNSDGLSGGVNEMELGSLEDYTYVTCHLPNKTFTKVYYDGGEAENLRIAYNENVKPISVCNPRRINPESLCETEQTFPTSDFLSSCHLCRKKLHGRDIYMYRGEKAFCSPECRASQMMMDERKEQCRSEASRSVEVSSSPYNRDQIFSTGILAL